MKWCVCIHFLIGVAGLETDVVGSHPVPPAGKAPPAYGDWNFMKAPPGSALASLSSGQPVKSTGARPVSNQAVIPVDMKAKSSGPSPVGDVHSAVRNLAKLTEPVAQSEPTGTGSRDEPSGLPSTEVARLEPTSSGVEVISPTFPASESSAGPGVAVSSAAVSHATASSEQNTLSISVLSSGTTTAISTTTPTQSGTALFAKPSAVPSASVPTQVSTLGGFLFGQPLSTTTSSSLFGPSSGPGVSAPLVEAPTVTSSDSASGQAAVVSTTSAGTGDDTSGVQLAPAPPPQPVLSTPSAETAVNLSSTAESVTVASTGVDTVSSDAAASASIPVLPTGSSASAPTAVFGHPSSTAAAVSAAGKDGTTTAPSVTGSGQPALSSVSSPTVSSGSLPAETVFLQPPSATMFGVSTSASVSPSSSSLPFGAGSFSSGTSLFRQAPSSSSGSSMFGQPASSVSAAPSSMNIFGQSSAMVSSASITGVFGAFGQPSSAPSTGGFKPFGFGSTSTSGFGQTPSFGQSTFGQSAFGQPSSRLLLFVLESSNFYILGDTIC